MVVRKVQVHTTTLQTYTSDHEKEGLYLACKASYWWQEMLKVIQLLSRLIPAIVGWRDYIDVQYVYRPIGTYKISYWW
jgi:hypothetical protein